MEFSSSSLGFKLRMQFNIYGAPFMFKVILCNKGYEDK